MSQTISATELSRSLSDVLNRIRYRGESFVVQRGGEAVASLGPVRPTGSGRWRELAERLQRLHVDDSAFADDLEAIQASQPRRDFARVPGLDVRVP